MDDGDLIDDNTQELTDDKDKIESDSEQKLETESEEILETKIETESLKLVYFSCACHNILLVLDDGMKFDKKYNSLIEKVSKDIVSKSKFSY